MLRAVTPSRRRWRIWRHVSRFLRPPASAETRFYFGKKPSRRRNSGIVKPCTIMEKATTPKVTTTISSRSGSVGGMESARASARAPRNPPEDMLFAKRDRPAGAQKEKTERIYRQAATKEHNNKRGQKNRPVRSERHRRDSDADEKKDHRIGEKRRKIPEAENEFLPPRRQKAFPAQQAKIGHHKTGRHGSKHTRHMEIIGDQERAISGNHGQGGLDQMFRTAPGDDECGTSALGPQSLCLPRR
jgi:hypothetical protein